jgi:hypothetical protein
MSQTLSYNFQDRGSSIREDFTLQIEHFLPRTKKKNRIEAISSDSDTMLVGLGDGGTGAHSGTSAP